MNAKARILLAEDDANLGFVIKDNLEVNRFAVTLCENGELAYRAFLREDFDLCVLDIMLPKLDGFSLAEKIREKNSQVPILFLTSKSMKEDKIRGFKSGGDDYITKPFSIEELVLRLEVFLKRSKPAASEQHLHQIGDYRFDYKNLALFYDGKEIHLTTKEAEILKHFCLHKDQVVKREDILNKVWGDDDYFMGRSLDVFISKLRKYLKNDSRIEILNYHGVGFKLEVKNTA